MSVFPKAHSFREELKKTLHKLSDQNSIRNRFLDLYKSTHIPRQCLQNIVGAWYGFLSLFPTTGITNNAKTKQDFFHFSACETWLFLWSEARRQEATAAAAAAAAAHHDVDRGCDPESKPVESFIAEIVSCRVWTEVSFGAIDPHVACKTLDSITCLSQCNTRGNSGCLPTKKGAAIIWHYPAFFFLSPVSSLIIPSAVRPTLLRQMDIGSLTCAQIRVRAVHTKEGHVQRCRHKSWLWGTEKQSFSPCSARGSNRTQDLWIWLPTL